MKQTAVEWLEEQMKTWGDLPRWKRDEIIQQAKEMEKAEKIKAQIDVLRLTHLRLSVEGIDKADGVMIFTINELEQQLKELTSKTDKE
jgi:hypothetical protein